MGLEGGAKQSGWVLIFGTARMKESQWRHVSGSGEIGDVHCARTATRMRRHANQENKKQDPKPRRQMHLFMLVY